MSALSIQPTYPIFTDIDGQPLEAGYVWIGTANLDPQTNPINVYWDAALTILAPQPIRTLAGYPSRNGTPARLYVNSDYSIRVMNKNGSTVYSAPNATERYSAAVISSINAAQVVFDPAGSGAVPTNGQVKWREYVTFQDFGAVGNGVADDTAAVQAAITYASANRLTIWAYGGFKITSTISFPSNTNGCTIQGQSKQTYFKFAGTGAMFASLSTNSIVMRNLTLLGPGSSIAATGLSLQTSNPGAGVYYCVFEDLTIEGFKFGISMGGLCEPVFRKINIGLNKSGLWDGSLLESCPLIGISIGTTVLAAQFEGLTIFATQRCVSQTTEQQLAEGHYWFGCTFDLSFNDGTSSDQACVYYESGQDINFTACWFTNSQKYGTASSFNDNILKIAYDPGSINAPLVAFKFNGCSFVGNDMSLQFGVPNANWSRREFIMSDCIFRIWANLSEIIFGGALEGMTMTGNVFMFYGDPITVGGVDKYNLPVNIINIADLSGFDISNNVFKGILPINQAPCYITLGDTSNGVLSANQFPQTAILTTGDDVRIVGTAENVIVLGSQQSSRRQLSVGITAGTYNGANPVIASIATQCSKPAMAIVNVYIDNVTITNPGAITMLFNLEGMGPAGITKREVISTGVQSIDYTFVGIVNDTVNFKVDQSLQMVVGAGTTAKFMTITFI